ncbi:hypothetical protein Bca101_032869 [Brassica carinata]
MGVSLSSETEHLTPSPRLDRNPLSCGLGQIMSRRRHLFPFCKQRSYASFLDDKLSVAIIITGRETREAAASELSSRDPRERRHGSQETSLRVLQLSRHLVEGGGGDDGVDALHDVVGSALEDQGESLVQYLLCVIIN